MEEEIKKSVKKCPVCEKEYSDGDNYCHNDGSQLLETGENTMSAMAEKSRDTDPDLREPSGHSE